jgi:hypothetical protein
MKVRNRYAKGRRNEWKSLDYLRKQGWMCFRTAGSHTDWDIIALKRGWSPMLVQVKTNRRPSLAAKANSENIAWGDYDPMWLLRVHLWTDYYGLSIFDARTMKKQDFV